MNDTTRRFLTAIVERVPADGRIVELRLFPAIRQGGMESAVAVVAVELADPALGAAGLDATAASVAHGDVVPADTPTNAPVSPPDYALAAHELVDTDVIAEEEEGGDGPDVETTASYVPHADAVDDDAVGDALDEELNTIVVNAARDVVAAEARAFAAAAGTHPGVDLDDAPTDATHEDAAHHPSALAHDDATVATGATDAEAATDDVYREEGDVPVEATVEPYAEPSAEPSGEPSAEPYAEPSREDSPYADEPLPDDEMHREILADADAVDAGGDGREEMRLDDILALPSPEGVADADGELAPPQDAPAVHAPILRYAILTASYRLTLKGPDRGKWEVELTHEADAPLATVERVARGVAKRAGEDSEPEHFSGESLQQALDAPAWVTTP